MSLFDEDVSSSPMEEPGIRIDRRTWLTGAASFVGATAAGLIAPALLPAEERESVRPTHVPGRSP